MNVIVSIGILLNFTPLVKIFGHNYILKCDDFQTEVINFLYDKVDIKPVYSTIKSHNGKVWKQTIFEIDVPYDIKISDVIEELEGKFEFEFKVVEEKKHYRRYFVYYNNLPIQILKINQEFPKVAIIFDDVGENIKRLKEIFKLNIPVTISVLPFLNYSKKSAVMSRKNDVEVMLHLPMEPYKSEVTPGIHTITTEMSNNEVIRWTRESIQSIPYIRGVNNHMGSKATADRRIMRGVLGVIKYYNLYFIDSRTNSKSVGFDMAKEMDILTGINSCYLDNKNEIGYIKKRLNLLIDIALEEGNVIAIGHFRKKTIKAVGEYIPVFENKGIKFVHVSNILTGE